MMGTAISLIMLSPQNVKNIIKTKAGADNGMVLIVQFALPDPEAEVGIKLMITIDILRIATTITGIILLMRNI